MSLQDPPFMTDTGRSSIQARNIGSLSRTRLIFSSSWPTGRVHTQPTRRHANGYRPCNIVSRRNRSSAPVQVLSFVAVYPRMATVPSRLVKREYTVTVTRGSQHDRRIILIPACYAQDCACYHVPDSSLHVVQMHMNDPH